MTEWNPGFYQPDPPPIPPATYVYPPDYVPVLPQDRFAEQNLFSYQYGELNRRAIRRGLAIQTTWPEKILGFVIIAVISGFIALGSVIF